ELKLYENPWLNHESPAVYLSGIEDVSAKNEEEEDSIIKKLRKNYNNKAKTNNQKNHVSNVLSKVIDVFTKSIDNFKQMSAYIHEINTGSASSIKQVSYCAASSMYSLIKNKIDKLRVKELVKE
ncbi:10185_t:CDS:1, partial [Cetraspora pellucida]